MAGLYVNAVSAFVCFELSAREASSFCDFWKFTPCDFISFISSMIEVNFWGFFDVLIEDKLPNLCPNMIHVDALDFSGWHSKEVISFFWRSVYLYIYNAALHTSDLEGWCVYFMYPNITKQCFNFKN